MRHLRPVLLLAALRVMIPDVPAEARELDAAKRGCCSHHHGVCGCTNGTAICCDQTPSPTCTC